jgi:citrate lyase beta subunit
MQFTPEQMAIVKRALSECYHKKVEEAKILEAAAKQGGNGFASPEAMRMVATEHLHFAKEILDLEEAIDRHEEGDR